MSEERTLYEMLWDLPAGAEAVLRRDRPNWFSREETDEDQ